MSGNNLSTDVEYSSSLLSCPFNGTSSSSTSELDRSTNHHQTQPSSTVSALTTLTRKSLRRQQTKNVTFQPSLINPTNNVFNDLFQTTTSTFSTLPKQIKNDSKNLPNNDNKHILNDFPTLQTVLNSSTKDVQTKLPQPPPLLNGILLLDQMLAKASMSNDDNTNSRSSSSSPNNMDWYNITCHYHPRASIV